MLIKPTRTAALKLKFCSAGKVGALHPSLQKLMQETEQKKTWVLYCHHTSASCSGIHSSLSWISPCSLSMSDHVSVIRLFSTTSATSTLMKPNLFLPSGFLPVIGDKSNLCERGHESKVGSHLQTFQPQVQHLMSYICQCCRSSVHSVKALSPLSCK